MSAWLAANIDLVAVAGAALLSLVLILLFRRWYRRSLRARTYSSAAPGADLEHNDPRWDPELECDEDLRAARLSVRVEPRVSPPSPEYMAGPPAGTAGLDLTPTPNAGTTAALQAGIAAARENPTDPLILQDLGVELAARGMLRAAASMFRQSLRVEENSLGYFYLAVCFKLLDRGAWARQALKLAVRADKGFAPAHAFLGFLALEEGDTSGAAVAMARSMALDPSRPEPHLGLGWLHLQRSEHEEAEWEFEEAFRAAPDFEDAVEAVRGGTNPVEVVRWGGVFAVGEEAEGPPELPEMAPGR